MSDIAHFFAPLNFDEISEGYQYSQTQFGHDFLIYKSGTDFPDLDHIDIAIVGVCEDRNALSNEGCRHAPDAIRPFLYK